MSFEKCISLYNHHLSEDVEHFYHPRKFLCIPSRPQQALMISITIAWFCLSRSWYKLNHIYILLSSFDPCNDFEMHQ